MTDKLSQYLVTITTQSLTEDFENLQKWLVQMSKEFSADTLLAHADDGVIWGKVVDSELITSHDALLESDNPLYSPPYVKKHCNRHGYLGKTVKSCCGRITLLEYGRYVHWKR